MKARLKIMIACEHLYDVLKERLPQAVVNKDEPMARRTTLRVGGCADVYVEPFTEAELAQVLALSREAGVPWRVIGRGSNLLVRDGGVRGVIISLAQAVFSRIELAGTELNCGAGAKLKSVAAKARDAALGGLEFFDGIPGSLGGALRMNAGAMGRATFDAVARIRYMDDRGGIHECAGHEAGAEYRRCRLFEQNIALGAVLRGKPEDKAAIQRRAREFSETRWKSQPKEPSAGCIFKNPSTALSAGKLIDQLGLKGTRHGGAVISPVHGNFIVNEGGATAADVMALIELIKTRAAEQGISLREEVEIIGEEPE